MPNGLFIRFDGGILVESGNTRILFDPTRIPRCKPDLVLITHAHRDHYSLKALRVIPAPKVMSPATYRLMGKPTGLGEVCFISPGEYAELSGISVRAYSAGHIVGSLQFAVDLPCATVVYTGDFCTERRVILEPAEVVKCDVLIIDSTYGDPRYTFPPRSELYASLLRRVREALENGARIALAGRRIGVAQELTAILALTGVAHPYVTPEVGEVNKVYEEFGETLGVFSTISGNNGFFSPVVTSINRRVGGYRMVTCTGWAIGSGGVPLSSHADFSSIVNYVLRSGAQTVYTVYGYSATMADHLASEYGFEASPLR